MKRKIEIKSKMNTDKDDNKDENERHTMKIELN